MPHVVVKHWWQGETNVDMPLPRVLWAPLIIWNLTCYSSPSHVKHMQLIANDVFLVYLSRNAHMVDLLSQGCQVRKQAPMHPGAFLWMFFVCLCWYNAFLTGRLVVAFYCLGSLDLLGVIEEEISSGDREAWKQWIWAQQARTRSFHYTSLFLTPAVIGGKYGSGFRPSPFMTDQDALPKVEITTLSTLTICWLCIYYRKLSTATMIHLI